MDNHGIARVARTARTDEQRRQDAAKIGKYRQLDDAIHDLAARHAYDDPALFQLTTTLLRLNPEYYTIWNVRRRCLTSGLLSRPSPGSSPSKASPTSSPSATTSTFCAASSPSSSAPTRPNPAFPTTGPSGTTLDHGKNDADYLEAELSFTVPLLLEFPKCYWIWKYRKWILDEAILRLPRDAATRIWSAELALDSKMLVKDSRNFHAWGYRRFLVARLESPDLLGQSLAEDEFAYTDKMILANLSNFSAWHSRSRLMLRVFDQRHADDHARRSFLDAEFTKIHEALDCGPEDQSLWYYDRYLVAQVVGSPGKPSVTPNLTVEQKTVYLENEIEYIKDLLEDYPDIKWPYEALLDYSILLRGLGFSGESGQEGNDPKVFLDKLRRLDPMQAGRWDDKERVLVLSSSDK
ncbi:hypothetical protein F5Y18DRAFT_159534 [Xylariaceae sp. FL1019]|nr:hypothetical protein F5Y18DRAFT_159534 [Xylariaceae sp. FL1019]